MMSLWDALRMNMMISYQELVRTFPSSGLVYRKTRNNICDEYSGLKRYGARPYRQPDPSEYRFLSEAGSGRLLSARCGGRFIQNDCRSSSGEAYPAAPADGLFRAPGRPAFPAGRGSALPVRKGAVSAEGCRQGEVLFISPHFTRLIQRQPG